ncbi:T9SS type A sorting domain-containing protein [Parasegetibacter sp. NRK P23]|uniref:T9SS type A sorting domain-containing protein n=1 Tax=Parasegetibacter sp. NRK P23 TaxID=2942999 RepID=UPI0020442506|nr:T9SS type A sorting domain-containing protein [Parasegetibacter sp. NRK P23]MCM5529246.1 T9SS type A sorting domain-containing protein [Parasegetibacter sp. NRK P23]
MKNLYTLLCLFLCLQTKAQVNAYAKVASLTGTNRLNLTLVNESFDTFEDGEQVIIIQMQDNVIGSYSGNNVNFGLLSDIRQAGRFELAYIQSHTEAAGLPTQLTLSADLQYTYNINGNSSVQVVSFPRLGSPNYTTTGTMAPLAWNGNIGGILAFQVQGTLTIAHNISASGLGFRGGATNNGNAGSCEATSSYRVSADDEHGNKGEGIYKSTSNNHAAGRARILSGGGGGNSHNAGGGGGGHITAGGEGGPGWGCSTGAGGMGGIALGTYSLANRIFMGGGGGAGEGNDNNNTAGGNGGGIVLISAGSIRTTGTATGLGIRSDGATSANVGNDGAGGAGAGGTVYIDCSSWSIAATAPLTIRANGGNGGNVNYTGQHGGGGGGGQGAVMLSSAPPTNATLQTLPGNGGLNETDGVAAASGAGTSNTGVQVLINAILPTRVLYFGGRNTGSQHTLHWMVADETPGTEYQVEKAEDGTNFKLVAKLNGKGTANYQWSEQALFEKTFYRIRVAAPGVQPYYTNTVLLRMGNANANEMVLQPNPAVGFTAVMLKTEKPGSVQLSLVDLSGRMLKQWNERAIAGNNTWIIALDQYPPGIYLLKAWDGVTMRTSKLVIGK